MVEIGRDDNITNYKISIIVPIYNAERYLRKCIDSILLQTYQNFEIVLINDGSTDGSGNIINKYVDDNPEKIRKIEKENGGLSSARNIALEYIRGEYVCFLDADDYIEKHYLEVLLGAAEEHDCDMVCSGQFKVSEKGDVYNTIIYNSKKGECLSRRLNISGKIYKVEYIKKWELRFPHGKKYEDNSFNLQALFLSDKIYFLKYAGYYQVVHEGSITSRPIDYKELPLEEWEYCIKKIIKNSRDNRIDQELFEFTTISFLVYFLFVRNRKREYLGNDEKENNLESVLQIAYCFQKIVRQYFPNSRKNKYAKIFQYRELPLLQRIGVKLFSWICFLHKAEVFTKFYYKIGA